MPAYRAYRRCLITLVYITTVGTHPFRRCLRLIPGVGFQHFRQFCKPLFVDMLNFRNLMERRSCFGKSFFSGSIAKCLIDISEFFVLIVLGCAQKFGKGFLLIDRLTAIDMDGLAT